MDRRNVEPAVLAVLAIVALALAAATLPSATESGGSGDGSLVEGSGEGGFLPTPESRTTPFVDTGVLQWLLGVIVVLAGIATIVYLYLYRREVLKQLLAALMVVAVVALVFWLVSHLDLASAGVPGWSGSGLDRPTTGSEDPSPRTPPLLLLLIVGVVLLGAVAIVVRGGSISDLRGSTEETDPPEDVAAVADAARRAADRIERTADVENEIYRAWVEMTALLDVARPESSTPGEFAAAAVDAGMAPDDVGELTRLFEDVRYGGDEPTGPMERRALSILRRVEATYASGEDVE